MIRVLIQDNSPSKAEWDANRPGSFRVWVTIEMIRLENDTYRIVVLEHPDSAYPNTCCVTRLDEKLELKETEGLKRIFEVMSYVKQKIYSGEKGG